jgi:hypothetical protein
MKIPTQNVFNFVCDYKVISHSSGDKLGQKLSSYFKDKYEQFLPPVKGSVHGNALPRAP